MLFLEKFLKYPENLGIRIAFGPISLNTRWTTVYEVLKSVGFEDVFTVMKLNGAPYNEFF